LEKGGLLEKIERPSIAIGKAKLEKEKLAKAKTKDEENNNSEAAS
jgi:small subunit ribosomal protein S16